MNRYTQLAREVRATIGQAHRAAHSIRVARCAELLAMRHGLDPERARTAGMLHDLARLWPASRLLEEASRRAYPIDDFERRNPIVLHAPLSALLARERFGIQDSEIGEAIAAHTLGAAEMSPLARVLFLADALEPQRDYRERAELWELALQDLDAAMYATLESTLAYARNRGYEIAPRTKAAFDTFSRLKGKVSTVSTH
uniref:bis(5'-nucleosyl)-tetraphosphatase (symmetrical) n=1 Tax=mine drainage metagenome TaxID=410659 RepID=E6Q695_9ZZZZ